MWNKAYIIHDGQIGVKVSYLISDEVQEGKPAPAVVAHDLSIRVSSYDALKKRALRTKGLRLREGKGAGNEALFSFENMPEDWQSRCVSAFGDPHKMAKEVRPLERVYEWDAKASHFYSITYKLPSGKSLDKDLISTYTINASVLNAVIVAMSSRRAFRKAYGNPNSTDIKTVWELVCEDVAALTDKLGHTLKIASLRRILSGYKKNGYASLISGKLENQNTAKVVTEEQLAVLEQLLKKHSKFDNVQIRDLYNQVAGPLGWKSISESTVAKYRKELDLYIYAGNSGETNFRNTRTMQNKRRAPNVPMVYWTLDGWDVELFYQETSIDKKGKSVTTYHNRPTVVVVLDPFLKYPIGYAIGTHETKDLIREAMRNAANHTKELFGQRYKSLQIQSDHYGKGTLTPLYEAMTEHYTPARVKNAKAKVIEPYFKALNKKLQVMCYNWSGFGVTSRKELQPNADYLNKIRHSFPDFAGVCEQVKQLIEMERFQKVEQYVRKWHDMADADHIALQDDEYLNLFGQTTGFTNKLMHDGLTITIGGMSYTYDSFDITFREHKHIDWCVKFDPADLNQVLVVNALSKNGRLEEEIGTIKYLLTMKYEQPMALHERNEGDAAQLALVSGFNNQLEANIIERNISKQRVVEQLFIERPELNGSLSKMILVDSNGQHKDQRNNTRLLQKANKLHVKHERIAVVEEISVSKEREEYINGKINLNDFIS